MSTWFTCDPPEQGLYEVLGEIRDESREVVMFRITCELWEGRWSLGGYTTFRGWRHWPQPPGNVTTDVPA